MVHVYVLVHDQYPDGEERTTIITIGVYLDPGFAREAAKGVMKFMGAPQHLLENLKWSKTGEGREQSNCMSGVGEFWINTVELDISKCKNCTSLVQGTMSCDKCGSSHCENCMGTNKEGMTLCLSCATIVDTSWGKFYRIDL